jgi:hypothetical protein
MVMAIEIASAKWVVASTGDGERKIRRKVLSQEGIRERFEALLEEIIEARRKLGLPEDARERDRLQGERRACSDRIVKKLRTQGLGELPKSWRSDLRERRLRTFAGKPLGGTLQHAMCVELDRLELVERKLKEIEAKARELGPGSVQRIATLQGLRGIVAAILHPAISAVLFPVVLRLLKRA